MSVYICFDTTAATWDLDFLRDIVPPESEQTEGLDALQTTAIMEPSATEAFGATLRTVPSLNSEEDFKYKVQGK